MAEEAAQVAQSPAPAPIPSPVADPTAFRGKGADAVFRAMEAEGTQQEQGEPVQPEATQEAQPQEAQQEVQLDKDDWKMRAGEMRKALESVTDPKIKKILMDSFMQAKAYRQSGLRLSDIERYLSVAPTPEVLQGISEEASGYRTLMEAVASGTEDGSVFVLKHLVSTSPQGAATLIGTISNHLEELHPGAYRTVAEKVAKNLVANMRHEAKRSGNPLLADDARGLAVFCGLESDSEDEGSEAADLPPEVAKEREELRLLKQREADRQREEERLRRESLKNAMMTFHQSVLDGAYSEGANLLKGWIEEHAGGYSDRVKAELFDRIGNALVEQINNNPHIQASYARVFRSGRGDPEHRGRAMQHLLAQAKTLLPHVAVSHLRDIAGMVEGAVAKRQDKVSQVSARRDVGSSGSPAMPGKPSMDPKAFRGKGMDAVFAALEAIDK